MQPLKWSAILAHLLIASDRRIDVTFVIGGSFTKWILWSVIMLTVPQLLLWFTFFGLPVTSTAGAIGTDWLAGIRNDVSPFIDSFIIGRLTIVLGAYFVVQAVLDAAQDGHPLPSVLTAMFLLAIPTTSDLMSRLHTGSRFAVAEVLDELNRITAPSGALPAADEADPLGTAQK